MVQKPSCWTSGSAGCCWAASGAGVTAAGVGIVSCDMGSSWLRPQMRRDRGRPIALSALREKGARLHLSQPRLPRAENAGKRRHDARRAPARCSRAADRRGPAAPRRGSGAVQPPCAGGAARRRQDHARSARFAWRSDLRALARRRQDHRAGAAPPRRARRGRTHVEPAGRKSRGTDRPQGPAAIAERAENADRGRHRGRFRPHDPRRSRRSTASRRCCSTNSTNARSTPISALPWRSTRRRRCGRTFALS